MCGDNLNARKTRGSRSPKRHRWTDEERRYIKQHRGDGAALLAYVLGVTPKAVQRVAEKMHVSLRITKGDICPVCGLETIRDRTDAARYGMCPSCWERRKAEAMRERRRFEAAHRDYEAAKKS